MKKIVIALLIIIYVIIVKMIWIENIDISYQQSLLVIHFKENLLTGSTLSRIGIFFLKLISTSFISVVLFITLIYVRDIKQKKFINKQLKQKKL
jgi:hypothetical protein